MFILFISFLLLTIPVLIPTWKQFWITSAIIGLPLAAIWGQYFYAISQPEYTGSPGEGLGLFLLGIPTFFFLLGMFIRYLRWVVQLKNEEIKAKREIK
jgi:hypothetical protein